MRAQSTERAVRPPNIVLLSPRFDRNSSVVEVLSHFDGVLVSDFYAAYDSVETDQQKCLIHLIGDFNDDVFKNPLDEELKSLARSLTDVMGPIIETIDKYGLRRRNLNKHRAAAKRYCANIEASQFKSELAQTYQRRIIRYAVLRRCFGMSATKKGIKEYLILLSICETLRRHGVSFLRFLQDNNPDINRVLDEP